MELSFAHTDYDRLEVDPTYTHGLPGSLVALYRGRLQLLRAAQHTKDLRTLKCLRFHPLEADAGSRHSVHLDDQHCLVVELREQSSAPVLLIVEVRKTHT
jgi:plasmid maintenance system killer protein